MSQKQAPVWPSAISSTSAVLRERIAFEQSKSDFTQKRLESERDDFKAKSKELATILENEQKEHALTRKKLEEALATISRFRAKPKKPPEITMNLGPRIPPIR